MKHFGALLCSWGDKPLRGEWLRPVSRTMLRTNFTFLWCLSIHLSSLRCLISFAEGDSFSSFFFVSIVLPKGKKGNCLVITIKTHIQYLSCQHCLLEITFTYCLFASKWHCDGEDNCCLNYWMFTGNLLHTVFVFIWENGYFLCLFTLSSKNSHSRPSSVHFSQVPTPQYQRHDV